MNSTDLILGIDGGGTKTIALLASRSTLSDEVIVGSGTAGAANPNGVGIEGTLNTLGEAIHRAFLDAGISPGTVAAACIALAGGAAAGVQTQLRQWAERTRLATRFSAVNDALPVLAAGTPDGWGVAVISGTGSLVFGRDRHRSTSRAGGWGHLFGDEGSGYALAVSGLRAVARATDGSGADTVLVSFMEKRFQVAESREMVERIYGASWSRADIASLAKVVCQAAAAGDRVAQSLVDHSADELADGVSAVVHRLAFAEDRFPLALAGGLLLGDRRFRKRLEEDLHQFELRPEPVTAVAEPVLGAVRLARQLLDG